MNRQQRRKLKRDNPKAYIEYLERENTTLQRDVMQQKRALAESERERQSAIMARPNQDFYSGYQTGLDVAFDFFTDYFDPLHQSVSHLSALASTITGAVATAGDQFPTTYADDLAQKLGQQLEIVDRHHKRFLSTLTSNEPILDISNIVAIRNALIAYSTNPAKINELRQACDTSEPVTELNAMLSALKHHDKNTIDMVMQVDNLVNEGYSKNKAYTIVGEKSGYPADTIKRYYIRFSRNLRGK